MKRRAEIGVVAEAEILNISQNYGERSTEKTQEFLSEVRVALRGVREFPFAKAVQATVENMEIRRVKIAHFPFVLSYFVYPSVDQQTGEPLDIIYVLGCRHEKQDELNWSARDPFHSP